MVAFQERFARRDDAVARRYEFDDQIVFVADLGPASEGTVDVLDDTAIVVVGDEQYEFELPGGGARTSMNNGVVTIEVDR